MKTTSLHNQSTSETPPDSEPTQVLADPSRTQRIAWTPPNTPPRLKVTSGGGPHLDTRARRDLLRGVAVILLVLFVLWRLPTPGPPAQVKMAARPAAPLVLQSTSAPKFDPLPSLTRYRTASDPAVRLYLVAPSVPLPAND